MSSIAYNYVQERYNQNNFNINDEIDQIIAAYKNKLDRSSFHNRFLRFSGLNRQVRDANTSVLTYKNRTLDSIYALYLEKYDQANPPRLRRKPRSLKTANEEIGFPFKTKVKYFDTIEENSIQPKVPDFHLSKLQRLFRPYFNMLSLLHQYQH